MAINKEIWVSSLVEGFFPNNSFATRSVDHSPYVSGHTVHVPQAGQAPQVTKNRNQFPATATSRTDSDLTYDINKYDTAPVQVQALDLVELSYDKRTSIISQSKAALQQAVMKDLITAWATATTGTTVPCVRTSGDAEAAHAPSATGDRKAMTRADVLSVKKVMDLADVPAEGRCILLDAVMYNQLLNSLTNAENVSFLAGADPVKGIVGRFMGFDFYMRSTVLTCTQNGALKTGAATTTDNAAGLAWQQDCVSRALGTVEVFESEKDPLYYGDVLSFAMRAGGTAIRGDKKGVVVICQEAAA